MTNAKTQSLQDNLPKPPQDEEAEEIEEEEQEEEAGKVDEAVAQIPVAA
jgi:hypothetical protein